MSVYHRSYFFLVAFFATCLIYIFSYAGEILTGTSTVIVRDDSMVLSSADGFVWLRNGFSVDSLGTTLNVAAPVQGTIFLGGYSLSLASDTYLASDTVLSGSGTVVGNGNALFLGGDLEYTGTLNIQDNLIIDGQGNALSVSGNTGQFVLANNKTLILKNIKLDGFGANSLIVEGTGSRLILDNATLNLADDTLTITAGMVDIVHDCKISGENGAVFAYTAAQDLCIRDNSTLLIDSGITFSHDNSITGTNIVFTSNASTLALAGGTFYAADDTVTVTLATGRLVIDGRSSLVGNMELGHTTSTLSIEFLPGGTLDISSGTVAYKNNS